MAGRTSASSSSSLMRSLSQRQVDELTETFTQFDLDKDGKITKAELVSVLSKLGFSLTERDVDIMMREADIDGNGDVDLDEFLQINAAAASIEDSGKLLQEVFEVFDKDKNGVISAEELREALTFLSPSGEPVTLEECSQIIKRVDANGDGVVDFPEFQRMMASPDLLPCSS